MAKETPENSSNINQEYNVAATGLQMDNSQNNIKKGSLSYALNAAIENFDSNSINYQIERGTEDCLEFPEGYKVLGRHPIPEKEKIIFFLVNPVTNQSEIGYSENNDCVYRKLVNDPCLAFDIDRPIHSVVHRITNFGTEIFWPDNNGRRYLDIDNIPYKLAPGSNACEPTFSKQLDCNKLRLQPNLTIPVTQVSDVISGGEITSGSYQFTVQFSDSVSNPYTSYFGVTNPVPIADVDTATVNFNLPVGKSIVVDITNLDPLGQFQYFNLAVIKTVNNITSVELVGTYFIDDTTKQIIYTGQAKTNIPLTIDDIFEKFANYTDADYVTAVQDILVWKGVTASERLNYQHIANNISLGWQSYRLPADEGYKLETNAANYRSYLRDEVYALELVFLKSNGSETDGVHIPGRKKADIENTNPPVNKSNPDFIGTPDPGTNTSPYWKIYNTAVVTGTSDEYRNTPDYKGPYKYGELAYWESSDEYPCDEEMWGELAGQKIRHHKMPDVLVSPIFENPPGSNGLVMQDTAIYPLGIKIDSQQVKEAIQNSSLTQAQKDDIVGFKIVRADRGVNKSIVAKGILRNVGKYEKNGQDYIFPNYPYNDLTVDPFLNKSNNAWSKECEEYTVQIFNIPVQKDGTKYVSIEYVSCNDNKPSSMKFTTTGFHKVCTMGRPKFTSVGNHNKMNHSHSGSTPLANTDAILFPSNYDEYHITWRANNAGGARVEWEDIVTGSTTEWLSGPFGGKKSGETLRVKVPVGSIPICIDSCEQGWPNKGRAKLQFHKSNTVEVAACTDEQPMDGIESETDSLARRQIFNSPETSFGQPFLGNILKLESAIYGSGKAHFTQVKKNARYRILSKEAVMDALEVAEDIGGITSTFSIEAMFSVYNSYLTMYVNGITRKNHAYSYNSIASYNYSASIPNNLGIKQRNLDAKRYLIPQVLSVGDNDGYIMNNYQRETSVYLKTNENKTALPFPSKTTSLLNTGISDKSRYTISELGNCDKPEKEENIEVLSYYGSLKNEFINQYGQVYSYNVVDTGFVRMLKDISGPTSDTIFGGDTFIGKFAFKTKLPFFIDNRVGAPDDSDIFYDEIGNVAYPKYWHSSRSILETYYSKGNSKLILPNFISYKATSFDCKNDQSLEEGITDPSTNPDRTFYDGYFYLFAYGVPSFYCESSYNLDLRTATNNKEGDFWPHVSNGIPDEWVQESNVTIAWDNVYNYNPGFSKQNKELVVSHLPADWGDVSKRNHYPFRAIYSDKQNTDADNRVNNWLTYRPISYFDFPQNYGNLIALDSLKDSAILARFENKSLLYNQLLTIDTSNPKAAYIGNDKLFTQAPPMDYAETDQGYVGCQNKVILKTPYGAVTIDAKRGQVFLLNGAEARDLTDAGSGVNRWFTVNLPFKITDSFPEINTDNHFKDFGLHGVYDSNYKRIIITKLDYIPLSDSITHENGKFFIVEKDLKKEIFLMDSDYFCNVSWTVSFNFVSNSWISFHSYLPNWYVGENNFFYSGLNDYPNDFDVFVGIIDKGITTTTTTSSSSTTTTSTTMAMGDCGFIATARIADCSLKGFGVAYIDTTDPGCTRESSVRNSTLFKGYNEIDTTVSSAQSCENMSYYNLYADDDSESVSYDPILLDAQITGYLVGDKVYIDNATNDCTFIPDGWYFSDETATANTVFYVENGIIIDTIICNGSPVTTTTTTTGGSLPTTTVCLTGLYAEGDPNNPLGGIVVYLDGNGDTLTESSIYIGDSVTITYSDIVNSAGVTECS